MRSSSAIASSTATHYLLPSSPDIQCDDRFSILDTDSETVSFWAILQTLLGRELKGISDLIDILETISLTLRGTSLPDYDVLTEILSERRDFLLSTWPVIRALALEVPILFPDHTLPLLSPFCSTLRLSRRQIACLVVHQFLCTLKSPPSRDSYYDFSIWYYSQQPHATAAQIYLTSVLTYFERLASTAALSPLNYPNWQISFSLKSQSGEPAVSIFGCLNIIHLLNDATQSEYLGLPNGACVISANKVSGFGQSGTQEERQVAASPEACPLVLIAPVLKGDECLIVSGAELMINIEGHGRSMHLGVQPVPESTAEASHTRWSRRTMFFMDALELDGDDCLLPDLLPGNVDREYGKALTAFTSAATPYAKIVTGFWGCGAFGGSPAVKAIVQWCAASVAGTQLDFICNGTQQSRFGNMMQAFAGDVLRSGAMPKDLLQQLQALTPNDFTETQIDELDQEVFRLISSRLTHASQP
ncbi:uncharacterized protein HMPREF1541_08709 [Cyphellophora europaea CBS 101466]|uniref:poly(ADP-ribose) glycohydrolase n=1 Tax=Cyphellophora europaea (strain CBS 101466) TaxID=1220924 RepID=W2RJ01_CYPE1|nr:uncharacterized protein HMPREF1541_08709 [Cyphellophora europaea CBS 101466]ETN36431.1 hypothetical protein HMPREF1541_08709 [Cyphellophora europaea CBS 101466]